MKLLCDLPKDQIRPGLKLRSSLNIPGQLTRITVPGDIVHAPSKRFAIVEWDNGRTSFLDMEQIRLYNKVQVEETPDV